MNKEIIERDIARIRHILDQIKEIEEFLSDNKRDRKTEKALQHNMQIIGEACRCMSEEVKLRYSDIPWKNMIGMRHILVHEYFRVDEETIWSVAENKIPALRDWMQGILNDLT